MTSYTLTGSTPANQRQGNDSEHLMQVAEMPFLFHWKAGGVGLNLTGADTVIFGRLMVGESSC